MPIFKLTLIPARYTLLSVQFSFTTAGTKHIRTSVCMPSMIFLKFYVYTHMHIFINYIVYLHMFRKSETESKSLGYLWNVKTFFLGQDPHQPIQCIDGQVTQRFSSHVK